MVHSCPTCGAKNRIPASRLTDKARCGKCKTELTPVGAPVPVSSAQEFDELIADSPLPVVVDFWAPWCGPCRSMAPELEKLARARSGQAVVAKVDTESLPSLGSRFGVQAIPTLVLFRGGREVSRTSGAMPARAMESSLGL